MDEQFCDKYLNPINILGSANTNNGPAHHRNGNAGHYPNPNLMGSNGGPLGVTNGAIGGVGSNLYTGHWKLTRVFNENDEALINRKLPKELLLRIFSHLDVVSLCRCAQVVPLHNFFDIFLLYYFTFIIIFFNNIVVSLCCIIVQVRSSF